MKKILCVSLILVLLLPVLSSCHGVQDPPTTFITPDAFDTSREYEIVFWAKNDTELCCVSLRDGAELYRRWTDPWLYTDLDVTDDGLVFGTSGGDGFLRCLDPMTGEERWKHAMKDGCAFYTRRENSIFTGDCSCRLFRIRSSDGAILQTLDTGTEVVGQFLVHGNSLYTVIWCTDTIPCRLIRVEI